MTNHKKSKTSKIHEASTEEILRARRMHREGADIDEIHAALGWDCHIKTTFERLLRSGLRVRWRRGSKRAHLGDETTP